MPVALVVATDRHGLLGDGDALPWGRALPGDLRRFRVLTLGHAVVMGRRTSASIGDWLPDRPCAAPVRRRGGGVSPWFGGSLSDLHAALTIRTSVEMTTGTITLSGAARVEEPYHAVLW